MKISTRKLIIFIITTTVAINCYAEPNKLLYELQEKCSKRTEEVFKDNGVSNTEDTFSTFSYQSHFSTTLNRCFATETITIFNKKSKEPKNIQSTTIYEVNEGKSMANIMKNIDEDEKILLCFIYGMKSSKGKKCYSEEEFNELTKPYTEQ